MKRYLVIAREIIPLALGSPLSKLANIAGLAVEVSVVTIALRNALGMDYASSVLVAIIVSGASVSGRWFFRVPFNLMLEAAIPPRTLRRIEKLVGLALDAATTPLIVLALTALATALGVADVGALNPLNLALLSIPPLMFSEGVYSFLSYIRGLVLRFFRQPYIPSWGPPSTAREAAFLFLEAVWVRLVSGTILGTLTPIYYSLKMLHPVAGYIIALLNPNALSIEIARAIIATGSAPLQSLLALVALSAMWFAVDMLLLIT